MKKISGKVVRVRTLKRKAFNKTGIVIVFQIQGIGEVARTFNLPPTPHSKKSELVKFLNSTLNVKIPNELWHSPHSFVKELEEKIKDFNFLLDLNESFNPSFPYNINSISLA